VVKPPVPWSSIVPRKTPLLPIVNGALVQPRRVAEADPVVLGWFVAEVDVADAGQLRLDRPVFGEVTWEALVADFLVVRAVRVDADVTVARA
jgi:hypothetical protein